MMARSDYGRLERERRRALALANLRHEPYAVIQDGKIIVRTQLRKAASYVAAHPGAQVVRTIYPEVAS